MAQVPFTVHSIVRYRRPNHGHVATGKAATKACRACRFQELLNAGCRMISEAELRATRSAHYAYLA